MTEKLKQLHIEWCRLTNQDPQKVRYQACERYFWDFHNNGFDLEDMTALVEFIQYHNAKRELPYRKRLNLHSLFSDMGYLASLIGEASAWKRNRKPPLSARQKAVQAFRGIAEPEDTSDRSKTLRDVMASIGRQ